MGYYISQINDTKLGAYIGSSTLQSVAAAGAFDSEVCTENEDLANKNEHIIAIVEKSGIDHCLNILKSGKACGRDISLLIDEIENNYKNGFKITY